jgi:hypothetical protein
MEESRTCTKCGEAKPLKDFGRKKNSKDGINWWCVGCQAKDRLRYKAENPFSVYLSKKKSYARTNGIPLDLTAEYLESIWTGVCPVFQTRLTLPRSGECRVKHMPSLDRIIPSKGYVKGNVEWISQYANTVKNAANASDLYKIADHVALREKEIAQHETD